MKKIFYIAFFAILTSLALLSGCRKEEDFSGMAAPTVMFTTDSIFIDLNLLDKPGVIGVVNSEAGLKSVEFFIVKGGMEEPFETKVAKFFNPHSHSFNYMPVYQEDYTGLKVLATDKAGTQTVAILRFGIFGVVDAPAIKFYKGASTTDTVMTINVKESEEHNAPSFTVSVQSIPGLRMVRMYNVINNREYPATDTIDTFFPNDRNFRIASSAITNLEYRLGITALKIVAVDKYGKIKIDKLNVNYIELPKPEIVINEKNITIDEGLNLPFSGTITSESGLYNVKVYAKMADDSVLVKEYNNFNAGNRNLFTFRDTIHSISSAVQSILVYAVDDLTKVGVLKHPISVNELYPGPSMTITSDTVFSGVDLGASLTFRGTITAGNQLKQVKILSHYLNGRVAEKIVAGAENQTSYNLNTSVSVESDSIIACSVVAIDKRDKKVTKKINVTVGFYEFRNVHMNNNTKLNVAPGALLSVTEGRAYTLKEAFAVQEKIDFGVYQPTTGATPGCLRFVVPGTADFGTRFDDNTLDGGMYSVSRWEIRNSNTKQMRETIVDYNKVKTVSDINKLATPSAGGWVNLVDNPYGPPVQTTIIFVTEGGRKGIMKFEKMAADGSFYISIKIKK